MLHLPKAGAEVLSSWMNGELLLSSTEVLDLDEDKYRNGEWVVRLYAEAKTPASPEVDARCKNASGGDW